MTEYEARGLPVAVAFPPLVVDAAWRRSSRGSAGASSTSPRRRSTPTSRTSSTAASRSRSRARTACSCPSPKVATYDLQPEMSAAGVTDALVAAIASASYDFIVANYANPDMVGHTGVWDAAVERGRVRRRLPRARRRRGGAMRERGGSSLCITADHGNADEMRDAARRAPDGALAQPGAARARSVSRSRGRTAARRRAGRRRADAARARRAPARAGDDRPLPAWLNLRVRLPARTSPAMETLILLAPDDPVRIALMASILLQSRGAGLGATFGGESSVYRSRRGIEKRLFQFTVVLAVLFVVFSSRVRSSAARPPEPGRRVPGPCYHRASLRTSEIAPDAAAPRWRNRQTR